MITKTYPLSLSRNYVSKWGLQEAVRELIQNALDSGRPFVYEFSPYDDTHTDLKAMSLLSTGVRLNPSALLLGSTDKTAVSDAIGQFGEGFKLALLVLTRLGHDVVIRNGPVTWRPKFEHSELFGDELLAVEETPDEVQNPNDLSFEVYGLSQDDVDAIMASCLLMQTEIRSDEKIVTPIGEILLTRPNVLYVGTLYVCPTKCTYGYNVYPSNLKLDRDRQAVGGWDLAEATREMWYATKRWMDIAEMIDNEVPDVQYAEYSVMPEELMKACYDRFRTHHPDALAAHGQAEADMLAKAGRGVVRLNAGMYAAVTKYSGYVGWKGDPPKTPQTRLQEFRDTHAEKFDEDMSRDLDAIIVDAEHWSIE